ncbi:MAG: NAD(P)/FAD-dependent oxidoreductase [Caulobacteraceae bacterium]
MTARDFLVIGSGIAGASLACELAPHARVTVVEQEDRPGYHTSGRSAAMYIESYGARPVRQLTAASRDFFEAPPAGFTDNPILIPRGCVTIARSDQSAALDAVAAQLAETGGAFRELSGAAVRAMVPVLKEEATARALLEPDSADIDVNALHQGFLRMGRARGVELRLDARVEALERSGEIWRARLAGGETLEAAVIVDAAGAWADEVAALAGAARLGLTPKRRTVILLDPPPGLDIQPWPTVLDAAEDFYFKPQSGLILASPCDETPSPAVDAAPEELEIAICVDRVQAAADLPVRRVAQAWAGLRTFAPDATQVFGYDPKVPGFFWFAGQGGYGMQTAPAAARLGAALARRAPLPADLADRGLAEAVFSPARFTAGPGTDPHR